MTQRPGNPWIQFVELHGRHLPFAVSRKLPPNQTHLASPAVCFRSPRLERMPLTVTGLGPHRRVCLPMDANRPDVLVLAELPAYDALVLLSLPEGIEVGWCRSLPIPEDLRPAAVIVVCPSCTSPFFSKALVDIDRLCLAYSTIVVTSREAENAYDLGWMWKWDRRPPVAWIGDEDGYLRVLIRDMVNRDLRRRACDVFLSRLRPEETVLNQGIRAAFLANPPPQHLREVAAAADVVESEFRRLWNKAGLPGRSEALVDWVLLAAVLEARDGSPSLARAALGLKLESWRVYRASYRRLDVAAGQLERWSFLEGLKSWLGRTSVASAK